MSARSAVEGANSGLPLRPPASLACGFLSSAGRSTVVLEMISPSMPVSIAASAISARSASERSGAILSSSGGGSGAAAAARADLSASINATKLDLRWRSRKPGVLGEDTLTTR